MKLNHKTRWMYPCTLSYEQFVVPLVKAVQEQQVMIEELKRANESMKLEIEALKKRP